MSIEQKVAKYAQDLGNWRVDARLGQGGFGLVVRLKRERFGVVEYCAMKIVHLCGAKKVNGRIPQYYFEDKSQIRQDDLKEVILMDALKGNTNIVDFQDWDVKEWVEDDKVECNLVIRMELLESLDKILADNRKLSEKEIIKIGTDICRALEICHKERIIHRDIKPGNIFRNRRGDYKLGDFGLSRITEKGLASTIAGTPLYAAPEQMSGGPMSKYGQTVDIYSLGLTLYQLANNNRFPFIERDYPTNRSLNEAYIRRISGEKISRPAACGEGLASVILKACAFKAEDRYQTASAFRSALENCNSVRNAAPVRNEPPVRKVSPVKKADPLPKTGGQNNPPMTRQQALEREKQKFVNALNDSGLWKRKQDQDGAIRDFNDAEYCYSSRQYKWALLKYSISEASIRMNMKIYAYPLIRYAECAAAINSNGIEAEEKYEKAVKEEPLLKDEELLKKIRIIAFREKNKLDNMQKSLDRIPYSLRKKWEQEMTALLKENKEANENYTDGVTFINIGMDGTIWLTFCGDKLGKYPADLCYRLCMGNIKLKKLEEAEKWFKELLAKEPSLKLLIE